MTLGEVSWVLGRASGQPPPARIAAPSPRGELSLIHPKSFQTETRRFTLRALPASCQRGSWLYRAAQDKAKIANVFFSFFLWVGFALRAQLQVQMQPCQLRVAKPGRRGWLCLPAKGDGSAFPNLERASSHQGRGFCRSPKPRFSSRCAVPGWLCIPCKRTSDGWCCCGFLLQIFGDRSGFQGPEGWLAGAARRCHGL